MAREISPALHYVISHIQLLGLAKTVGDLRAEANIVGSLIAWLSQRDNSHNWEEDMKKMAKIAAKIDEHYEEIKEIREDMAKGWLTEFPEDFIEAYATLLTSLWMIEAAVIEGINRVVGEKIPVEILKRVG